MPLGKQLVGKSERQDQRKGSHQELERPGQESIVLFNIQYGFVEVREAAYHARELDEII